MRKQVFVAEVNYGSVVVDTTSDNLFIIEADEGFYTITGYEPEDLEHNLSYHALIPEVDKTEYWEKVKPLVNTGKPGFLQHRILKKDRTPIYINCLGEVVIKEDGKKVMNILISDISHMKETANLISDVRIPAYVVKKETYELLYFNDCLKQMKPDVKRGKKCYQSILGRDKPCENCCISKLKEGASSAASIREDFVKGYTLDTIATNIAWYGIDNVSMVSIYPHFKSMYEMSLESDNLKLIAAISKAYKMLCSINLCDFTYKIISKNNIFINLCTKGRTDELFRQFLQRVKKEDVEEFYKINRSNVIKAFKEGKNELWTEVRIDTGEGQYKWCGIRVIKSDIDNSEHGALVFIQDIDYKKSLELEVEIANRKLESEQKAAYEAIPGFVIRFHKTKDVFQLDANERFFEYFDSEPKDYCNIMENFEKIVVGYSDPLKSRILEEYWAGRPFSLDLKSVNVYDEPVYLHLEASCEEYNESSPVYIGVLIDITNRVIAEEKLKQQTEFLQKMYDSIGMAIQRIRRSDEVLLTTNKAALKIFGCTQEQYDAAHRKSIWELVYPKDREKLKKIFYELEIGAASTPMEMRMLGSDGIKWVSVVLRRMFDHSGEDIIQGEFTDISAIRELREKENKLLLLEKTNQARTDFLFKMSHEIRTPINGIVGMTEVALRCIDDKERVQGCLKKTLAATNYLKELINDILDMSRIESGKLKLDFDLFNLNTLIEELNDIFLQLANKKGIRFRVTKDDINRTVYADQIRIGQVIMNLVGNALKFTPKGGIVELSAIRMPGDKGMYCFTVKDSGIGIRKEDQKKIFKSFEQAAEDTAKRFGGSGLGLAICKSLVEMMKGEITVKSDLGEGSEFKVLLTLSEREKDCLEEKCKEESIYDFRDKRILVVEDNELNAEIAVTLLELNGAQVETAVNGREAVDLFINHVTGYYDMILMDIQMPVMDGYEAARIIRSSYKKDAKTVKIIAMSANAFDSDIKKSLENGMDSHLSKPIDTNDFYRVVQKFFQ